MLPTTTFEMSLQTINRMIAEQNIHSMFDRFGEVMDKVVNRSYDIYRDLALPSTDYFESTYLSFIVYVLLTLQKSVVCAILWVFLVTKSGRMFWLV